jgi:prepilin-type N-terminal cleavage/methylation domain-containing protein
MKKDKQNKKQAFTLIELSIVLIIIGLVVGGVVGGSSLINSSRLLKARTLTNSSPVHGTENLALWLESTSAESFLVKTPNKDAPIDLWQDLNQQETAKNNAIQNGLSTLRPTYAKDGIGGLPTLNFDGSNNYLDLGETFDLNGKTLFIVADADDVIMDTDDYVNKGIFGQSATDNYDYHFTLGPMLTTRVDSLFIENNAGSGFGYVVSGMSNAGMKQPLIVSFSARASDSLTRINGNENINSTSAIGTTDLRYIGVGYGSAANNRFKGSIGEIIVFDRVLGASEISAIEEYLSKKWNINLN